MSDVPMTMAACDVCGRGYIYIHHEGVECLEADGGHVRTLPEAEVFRSDSTDDRMRRRAALRKHAVKVVS